LHCGEAAPWFAITLGYEVLVHAFPEVLDAESAQEAVPEQKPTVTTESATGSVHACFPHLTLEPESAETGDAVPAKRHPHFVAYSSAEPKPADCEALFPP